ncbi:hypothetical protein BpHYR1_015834 [Brachionus plicatilis]|uniref:Uncharacterized protein n=1 Tax=Brachionus plicatilis TaxID=10195 RepID=A0A3M7SPA9_BRAPC|nr:hypothetical protein BpHYR1_015834 [Brachionus plicatilis]
MGQSLTTWISLSINPVFNFLNGPNNEKFTFFRLDDKSENAELDFEYNKNNKITNCPQRVIKIY